MRNNILSLLLFGLLATICNAVSSWGFQDASISIHSKEPGVDRGLKEKENILVNQPLKKPLALGTQDTLKILLTTTEDGKPKRPHQTFLHVSDPESNLETSFVFQVKESGKGTLQLTHKEIPLELLSSSEPLIASLIIASFGSSKPYNSHAFDLSIAVDPSSPLPPLDKPLRYGKLPEIHHQFKPDPTNPPIIITLAFTAAVLAALPALLIMWVKLGANLNHLSKAFRTSPVSHAMFFGSIVALEGIFFLYYTHWKLFQALPSALGIALVAFLSGSRALREVQQRRFAGLR
ncbi:MAG: hypothetical protein Q9163_002611 [Psora crenata]